METTDVILNEKNRGEVELFSDGKKVGFMEISVYNQRLTVYHTEVDSQYEGRGFAKLLLGKLVSYARENDLKIVALCPYVHAQFRRHPEDYQDVWYNKEA
ncbi:GCN5-related N-acetyltransferase [Pseudopedobacter saltans DSM 12145]|uniref:GCN5-related N-acetyltransferase n=1 Tax=Pseudopedobacter saltans (strain ATCC 51119 / DSM 12145 / JCM 21818 / CCUG 39354 / LMG 10337 / NBRC 100064 / NCIMB 13643) TaxID=762903 RepID=F0S7E5_PSESL|nr:GNAT family N-acetyltransferase [Pseudopedobacter saltans]ADY51170.1 GCN5-related N-acetyltransferase [Pseudopedobacter saltans DSM 12145]